MTETPPPVEAEVRHYAGVLRQAVRAAGLSVSEVERRLGTGPKALRRVFRGTVDLKLKHVISVLRVIGMSQEEFFAIASRTAARTAGRRPRRARGSDLLTVLERLGYRGELVPIADDVEAAVSEEQFDRLVEEVVERVMVRRARQGKPLAIGAGRVTGTAAAANGERAAARDGDAEDPDPGSGDEAG